MDFSHQERGVDDFFRTSHRDFPEVFKMEIPSGYD